MKKLLFELRKEIERAKWFYKGKRALRDIKGGENNDVFRRC